MVTTRENFLFLAAFAAMVFVTTAGTALCNESTINSVIDNKIKQPCYTYCQTDIDVAACKEGCDCIANAATPMADGIIQCFKDKRDICSDSVDYAVIGLQQFECKEDMRTSYIKGKTRGY